MSHLRHCYQRHTSPDDLNKAALAMALGRAEQEQANYKEAEILLQEALTIYQELQGNEHPSTATSLNNLAIVYTSQGHYLEAEPLYKQALGIYQGLSGVNHLDTVTNLNNLAVLYRKINRYEEAKTLFQQALRISEKQLGLEHRATATIQNNLADLYRAQGRYSEAESIYQQALEIHQQQLGKDHPDTAVILNNLAALHYSEGNYQKAEPLYQQALDICKQELGDYHPNTATALNNLAGLYERQGRYQEGASLYQQALQIREGRLGEDHILTQNTRNTLARCQRIAKNLTKAETEVEEALSNPQIIKEVLVQKLKQYAQQIENIEETNSPWLVHAAQVRSLIERLDLANYTPPNAEEQITSILAQAEEAVKKALADPSTDRKNLAEQLEEKAQWAEDGEEQGSAWLVLAARLRELAARLQG